MPVKKKQASKKQGTTVRAFRKFFDWSQNKLGEKAELSPKTVDNVETRLPVAESTARKIVRGFQSAVPELGKLLEDAGEPKFTVKHFFDGPFGQAERYTAKRGKAKLSEREGTVRAVWNAALKR